MDRHPSLEAVGVHDDVPHPLRRGVDVDAGRRRVAHDARPLRAGQRLARLPVAQRPLDRRVEAVQAHAEQVGGRSSRGSRSAVSALHQRADPARGPRRRSAAATRLATAVAVSRQADARPPDQQRVADALDHLAVGHDVRAGDVERRGRADLAVLGRARRGTSITSRPSIGRVRWSRQAGSGMTGTRSTSRTRKRNERDRGADDDRGAQRDAPRARRRAAISLDLEAAGEVRRGGRVRRARGRRGRRRGARRAARAASAKLLRGRAVAVGEAVPGRGLHRVDQEVGDARRPPAPRRARRR